MKAAGSLPRALRIDTLAVALTVVLLILVVPATDVNAHHGAYHWDQHSIDWSSTIEVWPHTGCTTGCNQLQAEIWKTSAWYGATCNSGAGNCFDVFGPHKTYSFPVTVSTRHGAIANPDHSGGTQLDVYYP